MGHVSWFNQYNSYTLKYKMENTYIGGYWKRLQLFYIDRLHDGYWDLHRLAHPKWEKSNFDSSLHDFQNAWASAEDFALFPIIQPR